MERILIVDDSIEFLTYVKTILERESYSVVAKSDTREAFEEAFKGAFELILIDANLNNGFSGFDFIRSVRSFPGKENVPIALLTALKEKQAVQKALDCGADDFIAKPIDPPLFLIKIQSLIENESSRIIKLAEGFVLKDAVWTPSTQITHVNENGMTLISSAIPEIHSMIKIKSEFFDQLGIGPPPLRVVSWEKAAHTHAYYIKVSFVGLNDSELQKIRMWVNSHARPS